VSILAGLGSYELQLRALRRRVKSPRDGAAAMPEMSTETGQGRSSQRNWSSSRASPVALTLNCPRTIDISGCGPIVVAERSAEALAAAVRLLATTRPALR
jgi:hypothetical protein